MAQYYRGGANLVRYKSMTLINRTLLACVVVLLTAAAFPAQDRFYFQTDFTKQELAERRTRIYDEIGKNAIAVIQGAKSVADFSVFRQSNTFYYLTGLETPHAYLLLDGRSRRAIIYLPHRDAGLEANQGKVLSAEDADLVRELTGAEQVRGIEFLSNDLTGPGLIRPPAPTLFTPLSPEETGNDSRDELLAGQARVSSDPWDGLPSRESRFKRLLNERFPQYDIRDLSPVLDAMRTIKSRKEIELIRKATYIAGLGLIEAMRSTEPGVYEYQLDAAAKYVFYLNGARGDAYSSIVGGGTNAYFGHYFQKADKLKDGDLVLMDYAPDYRYYTSDVTRMWPVNGRFNKEQRELLSFINAYRDALFRQIRPRVTSDQVLDQAAAEMEKYLAGRTFTNPAHLKAVSAGLKFRGHFQHPVGMAVHDVGRVRGVELRPGMVFTIDPMIWIPEERLYVRIEDVVVVTAEGAENLSAFVPSDLDAIEQLMTEKGLVQLRPVTALPVNK